MQVNVRELFVPGAKAIITRDPFGGRYGDLVGASVTITRYGGFEDVGFRVDGVRHPSVCMDDEFFIVCDDNGRPLPESAEINYRRLDIRRGQLESKLAKLDAERDLITALISGALSN